MELPKITENDAIARTASSNVSNIAGKIAILGDSLSSALGYDQTGAKQRSLVDFLGQDITNVSRGGMTTYEALTGKKPDALSGLQEASAFEPFGGTFETFLNSVKPETVLLRYGAADAALLRDPKTTITNIEKMIQMSKTAGSSPVLVGIPPVAKSDDPRHGGLEGNYFDYMPPLVDEINSGMRELASKYGIKYIDLSNIEIPKGGLLDGLHPNVETGEIIAREIKDQIKTITETTSTPKAAIALGSEDKLYDPVLGTYWEIDTEPRLIDPRAYTGSFKSPVDAVRYINPSTGAELTRAEYLATANTPEALAFQADTSAKNQLSSQINTLTDSGQLGVWSKNGGYGTHQNNLVSELWGQGVRNANDITYRIENYSQQSTDADGNTVGTPSKKIVYYDKTTNKVLGESDINSPAAQIGGYGEGKGRTRYYLIPQQNGAIKIAAGFEDKGPLGDFAPIASFLSWIPIPIVQQIAQVAVAVQAASTGNPISAIATLAGMGGFTEIAQAANVAQAIKSGNPIAIAQSIFATEIAKNVGNLEIGGGFKINDALTAVRLGQAIDSGDWATAVQLGGVLANSSEARTAGQALRVIQALDRGDFVGAMNAMGGLTATVNQLKNLPENLQKASESLQRLGTNAIGAVSVDVNGNQYVADDDGNRIMLTGASPGRTYTADEWNGIQAGLNAGQSQFVSSLLREMNNGVMSPDDVRYELGQAGYSAAQIQKIETANQQYIERARNANQAIEDYAAVGSDVSRESIVQRLQDLGYSAEDADRVIGNVDKQVLARNAYPNVARDFVQGNATEAQLRDAMEAAGIRGDVANDQLTYYRAVKAGDELTSSEATQAAVSGLRQWQVIDRKGTQISWAQNPDDGSYYVKAARDGTGKDITDTFLGATPQSIDKYRIEQQQQYVDRLSKQLTGTAERFFAPGSTMTEAQAISLLKQNDGMTDAMARQVVTGWNDQKAAIEKNTIKIDYNKQTTSRMLSFEEFESVLGKAGIKDDLLTRYRAYQYTQGALYQAGKIKDGENPLPGEIVGILNKGKPAEPLPKNEFIESIGRGVQEGIAAGQKAGNPVTNFINSLNANLIGFLPRVGAGLVSDFTQDAANDVAVALRGIANIASTASDNLMPELAAESQARVEKISNATGWGKFSEAWKWATDSPLSAASLAWSTSKELSEDLVFGYAILGKALKVVGNSPGQALGMVLSELGFNYGSIIEENIAQLTQEGLDPRTAAIVAGQGAMPAAMAETIVGMTLAKLPLEQKTFFKQLLTSPVRGAVDGAEETFNYIGNQFGMGRELTFNDGLTAFVIGQTIGTKADIQASVLSLLSPQGQGQLIKNLDALGYQVGIDPKLIPADVKGTVTSVIGNTAVISGPNNQTYVLDVSNQNLTKGSVLNIEGFDTKPVQLTTGQMDSLLSTIDGAYQNQIGRQATFDEISNNIQGVVGKSQSELEATLNQTVDGKNFDLVNTLYQNALGRKPTKTELETSLNGLKTGSLDSTGITNNIQSTQEFKDLQAARDQADRNRISADAARAVSISISISNSISISEAAAREQREAAERAAAEARAEAERVSISNSISLSTALKEAEDAERIRRAAEREADERAVVDWTAPNGEVLKIPKLWSEYTNEQKIDWLNDNKIDAEKFKSLGLSDADISAYVELGLNRGVWKSEAEIAEESATTPWTSPNGTIINVPAKWGGYTPEQKISWLNSQKITATSFQNMGLTDADINAYVNMGLERGGWKSESELAAQAEADRARIAEDARQAASVSQSLSQSESIRLKQAAEAEAERISISESISLSQKQAAEAKAEADRISISNSISLSQKLAAEAKAEADRVSTSKSISESISISNKIKEDAAKAVSVSNSISVSQSISTAASISASVSQSISNSISTSQSLSASKSISLSQSQSASVSTVASISASKSESISNSISTSQSLSASKSVSISESTSISILDKQFLSEQISASKSESVSISKSLSASRSVSISESTSLSILDKQFISEQASISKSLSQSISTSLINSVSASKSASISTSVSVVESQGLSQLRNTSASISASISAAASISLSNSLSLSASISEEAERDTKENISASVSASISQSAALDISSSISASKSASISEKLKNLDTSQRVSVSESISISESLSQSASASVSQSVSQSISQTVAPTISVTTSTSQSISESISQTVSVSESISETVSQSITKQISETPSKTISITFTPTLVITTPTPTVTVTETVTFTTPPPTIPWPPTLSYTETTSVPVTTTEAPTTTKPVTTKPVTTKPVTTPPPPFPLFMVPGYDQTKRYIDYAQPNVPAPEFGPYDPFKAPNYLRPLQDSGNFGLAALVGAFDNASQPGNGGNQPK